MVRATPSTTLASAPGQVIGGQRKGNRQQPCAEQGHHLRTEQPRIAPV